jgi:trehalose 6-phosphate phosphatase
MRLTCLVLPEPRTHEGVEGLEAILAHPGQTLVAFDYDGTLSPIVDDPSRAHPEPEIIGGLAELSTHVDVVAVITGRPAQLAVDLAGFAHTPGLEDLVVIGHYGMERWDACSGELGTVEPPPGVAIVKDKLPDLLSSLGLDDAEIEDKGLSVAVHVRTMDDSGDAFEAMVQPLRDLAESAGLVAEPGRMVVELRPPGMDKGRALRELVRETQVTRVMFVGDDLGDLAAFDEVDKLRKEGIPGLLVCSGSAEVEELAARADIVVDGPRGVSELVGDLVDALTGVQV